MTSAPTREPALLERDGEVTLIESLIAATAAGEGGLLVVEAEAGVGKTELLRTAGTIGEAAGLRVLRARGSELDRPFAFGLVRQLLEREAAASPELLTGAAEPAAAVLGVPGAAAQSDGDPFSSLQGLVWFVADLSARSPLLLQADDLHWADTPSLRWLAFLAERLEDVAVLVAEATRPAEPGADQGLLDALALAAGGHTARPAPSRGRRRPRSCRRGCRRPSRPWRGLPPRDGRQSVPALRARRRTGPPRPYRQRRRGHRGPGLRPGARGPRAAPAHPRAPARGHERDAGPRGARSGRLARGHGGARRPRPRRDRRGSRRACRHRRPVRR